MNDYEIVKLIENEIESSYLSGSSLVLKENTADNSTYNSVLIKSPTTAYRNATGGNKSILFCRIKNSKAKRYVSFSSKYEKDFSKCGFNTTCIESDKDFFRIDIDEFVNSISNSHNVLNRIFREAFTFESFGCCSKYKQCSEVEKCIHEDQLYATACMYRKHLENGNIFYKDTAQLETNDTHLSSEDSNTVIKGTLIPPPQSWTRFQNDEEKIEYLKNNQLIPVTAKSLRQFYYSGIYAARRTVCEIVGYFDKTILVIEIENQLHCISADYLKEIQPTRLELSQDPLLSKIYDIYKDIVVLDVETTGLSNADEIIEISMIKVQNGLATECFSKLVKPSIPIPSKISKLTGITDDMVLSQQPFGDIEKEVNDFIGNSVIVGHNVSFDLRMISNALGRIIYNKRFDTMLIAREVLPNLEHHKLKDIAKYYGIDYTNAHRALNDCEITLASFDKLTCSFKKDDIINGVIKCLK